MQEKLVKASFTLDDMLDSMQQMQKLMKQLPALARRGGGAASLLGRR